MSAEGATDDGDQLIGEILANRYQIEERLGEGAMGAVYRARHVKVGRPFAVKVLHQKLLEDLKIAQRFEREAELAGRLRHPNVIGVVDVGETADGLRYMVMDFAKGRDLAALLEEAPLRPERIIHLTRQLLEGLYHAHEAGLIHRDFKPENVIVERDDHGAEIPRIVDFGIAILREGGESTSATGRLTTNGLVLGTPHYMAPEQAVADPIDHRIDLFALGIVIYEMLSGKLPFDGTGAEVARANLLLDPPPIAQRVPYLEVDPLLEAFARRLLAKKRDHRPATAKAARELLDLIERDRTAAAATLGVPLAGTRTPQVTQDVVPHAPVNEDSGELAIAQAEAAPPPRPGDLEAPPVERRGEALIETAPAAPLGWQDDASDDDLPRTRKRGWLVAGLAAAVAAAAVVAIVATRGGHDQSSAQQVAIQATAPAAGERTADPAAGDRAVGDRIAAPAAGDRTAAGDHTADPTAGDPTAGDRTADPAVGDRVAGDRAPGDRTAGDHTPDPAAGDRAADDRTVTDRAADAAASRTATDRTATDHAANRTAIDRTATDRAAGVPAGSDHSTADRAAGDRAGDPAADAAASRTATDRAATARGASRPTAKRPAARPDKPPPAAATPPAAPGQPERPAEAKPEGVTPNALVAQYTAVGKELKALGDKASDLWPRYRLIRINEAMGSPQKRSDAAAILSQLQRAAASRK